MFNSKRIEEREEGIAKVNELIKDKNRSLIIHYSSESFITNIGTTPRINCICIRNIGSSQTKKLSLHTQAEINHLDLSILGRPRVDQLEKEMLDELYKFISLNKNSKWIHWNMSDGNYGFEAIAIRYRILGGTAVEIDDDKKYDISRILSQIYTYKFQSNLPKGRLLNLAAYNHFNLTNALSGEEEAEAFSNHEYLKLNMSTQRKVDFIDSFINLVYTNRLKVRVKFWEIYGLSPNGIVEIVRNSWVLLLIIAVLGGVFWAAVEPKIQRWFGTDVSTIDSLPK